MTRLDKTLSDFELFDYAQALSGTLEPIDDYNNLIFPMVDLKQQVDISWLLNMATTSSQNEPVKIAQALQETHLAVNHQGARAESAVALSFPVGGIYQPRSELVIDSPFLTWFQRPGLIYPLFVGYITEQDWKNPGAIL